MILSTAQSLLKLRLQQLYFYHCVIVLPLNSSWKFQCKSKKNYRAHSPKNLACHTIEQNVGKTSTPLVLAKVMAYSDCTRTGLGQDREWEKDQWRNVHTGLRQGQGPGCIVSFCASSVPCTGPVSGPVQCD